MPDLGGGDPLRGHAGDGNIHFSVYEPDDTRRSRLLRAIFTMGRDMGGAVSGEHGIGRAKCRYFEELGDRPSWRCNAGSRQPSTHRAS